LKRGIAVIGLAVAAPCALAQSVTIYGLVDVAVEHVTRVGASGSGSSGAIAGAMFAELPPGLAALSTSMGIMFWASKGMAARKISRSVKAIGRAMCKQVLLGVKLRNPIARRRAASSLLPGQFEID